jgi:signal peptidase I
MDKGKVRRYLRSAEYAVTAFVIAVAVFAAVEYATGTQPFYAVGDNPSSMSPSLNYGDVAVIYKAPFSSLSPGTIIAFHDPRGNPGIIVHRVVSLVDCAGSKCLVTKGDNKATNPTTDPWNVTESEYIGQAVLVVPDAGYVSPSFWGFNGASALLPISFLILAVAAVSMFGRKLSGAEGKKAEG